MSSKRFSNDPPLGTRPLKPRLRREQTPSSPGPAPPDAATADTQQTASDLAAAADAGVRSAREEVGPGGETHTGAAESTTPSPALESGGRPKVNLSKRAYAETSAQPESGAREPTAQAVAGSTPGPDVPLHRSTKAAAPAAETSAGPAASGADAPGPRTAGAPVPKKKKPWGWVGAGAAAVAVGAAFLAGPLYAGPAPSPAASMPAAQTKAAEVSQMSPSKTISPQADSTAADLELNADGRLMDMTYRYNGSWVNQADPLESGSTGLYELDLGTDGTVLLCFAATSDSKTQSSLAQLESMSTEERAEAVDTIFTSAASNLDNGTAELAAVPPQGTLAMWSYTADTDLADGSTGKMRGYSFVGPDALYTVFAAAPDTKTLDAFDPTLKQIAGSLRFSGTVPAPAETEAAAPAAAPVPAAPAAASAPSQNARSFDSNGFVFADSSERYLTDDDLAGLSAEMLGFARNEIFARNGNLFRKDKYINHYGAYSWYVNMPNKRYDIVTEDLTDIERANVALIQEYEAWVS